MPRRRIDVDTKILRSLRTKGPMSWGGLQAHLGVSKAALSVNLNWLIKHGYVKTKFDLETRPPRTIYFVPVIKENAYLQVEVPDALVKSVKQWIKTRPEYTSWKEFLYDAVVEKLIKDDKKREKRQKG